MCNRCCYKRTVSGVGHKCMALTPMISVILLITGIILCIPSTSTNHSITNTHILVIGIICIIASVSLLTGEVIFYCCCYQPSGYTEIQPAYYDVYV
jgi:uncharacterized membrane protein HdeD (DUF308 family)